MITPERAREVAEAYLRENRPSVRFAGLLEDRRDYMVKTETTGALPIGPTWLFISKTSGRVREEAFGDVFDKVEAMTEVPAG